MSQETMELYFSGWLCALHGPSGFFHPVFEAVLIGWLGVGAGNAPAVNRRTRVVITIETARRIDLITMYCCLERVQMRSTKVASSLRPI